MDFSKRLAMSFYKTIAVINEPHKIYLVQHQETNKIFIKKILDVYNIHVYEYLFQNPITGIPNIIDYYEDNQQLILIEEYISGCSLQEKIDTKTLSSDDIQPYMMDLCTILKQLHSLNPPIIHRDIKPSNLIITNYNRVVLLDFNAAKQFTSASQNDTVLLGTHGYAAPEQYGFGSSTPQTDIYSLGILLKEMLAACPVPNNSFSAIIDKCTKINPLERYQSIAELENELSPHRKNEPLLRFTQGIKKWLPPGYRTKTPWKMFLSTFVYLFLFWLCLSMELENTYGTELWMKRIFFLIILLFLVFGCFNYRDMQRFLPLCKHKNRMIHYLGIALLEIGIFFFGFFLLAILETTFFP